MINFSWQKLSNFSSFVLLWVITLKEWKLETLISRLMHFPLILLLMSNVFSFYFLRKQHVYRAWNVVNICFFVSQRTKSDDSFELAGTINCHAVNKRSFVARFCGLHSLYCQKVLKHIKKLKTYLKVERLFARVESLFAIVIKRKLCVESGG